MSLAMKLRETRPPLVTIFSLLATVACGFANEPLPEVSRVPLGLACYPVQYLKPPLPPPSGFCLRPESVDDPEIVMLLANDGSIVDAYITSEQSEALHACLIGIARRWPLEPARDCTGAPMAGEFRLPWSSAFGNDCTDFKRMLRSGEGGRTSGCS